MTTAHPSHGLLAGRLVVCLGPGGVGKTTVSAALALGAAMAGRRVDVMTVDPAPRLLDALGLDAVDAAEPREVSLDGLADVADVPDLAGLFDSADSSNVDSSNVMELAAAARGRGGRGARAGARRDAPGACARCAWTPSAPSTRSSHATRPRPPPPTRSCKTASTAISRRRWPAWAITWRWSGCSSSSEEPATDLVVLDTPPAREALDFLDAPRRLLDLLNSRAVTLLGGGMRRGFSVVDLAARAVLSAFDRLTGLHLLGDVQAFVRSFDGMYAGFAERAARAQQLLVAGDTAVVVVTTAEPERIGAGARVSRGARHGRNRAAGGYRQSYAARDRVGGADRARAARAGAQAQAVARGRGLRGAASARSRRDSVVARGLACGIDAARGARPRTRAG